jgi:hypothetical protein
MMSRVFFAVSAATLCACEPKLVDVTYEGVPKCESGHLAQDIALKLLGPRVSSSFRVTGDGAPLTGKLVAGKLYKLKAYKCASNPCESDANFFHGEDVTAPVEGQPGTVTLHIKGAPACVTAGAAPAAVDAGGR